MKMLWVKTNLLHPLDSGGTIRTYHMLRHLKRHHEIHYVTLVPRGSNGGAETAHEYCHRVTQIPWSGAPRRTQWRFYAQALANLGSSLPLALERYHVPALRDTLRRLTAAERFDIAVCDFLFCAPHFDAVSGIPKVLFQHNVETLIWERMAQASRGLARPYFASQARRMRRWEGRLARQFDHVVTVSPDDAQRMRHAFGIRAVSSVPTGVDGSYYHPAPGLDGGRRVLFLGALDWLPNIKAVRWLLDEIWPRIRTQVSDAELCIVGRRPSRALGGAIGRTPGAQLYADVSDVRPYLWGATVVLVPLQVGGGTRIKILEALACARAVVSTPVGAEGLPLRHGVDVLLAATAEELADRTVELLRDETQRVRLGDAGRALVERSGTWERAAEAFTEACASALDAAAMRA